MKTPTNFDDAIDAAVRSSATHKSAIDLAQELTSQLADAIEARTSNDVTAKIMSEEKLRTTLAGFAQAVADIGKVRHSLGDDKEDQLVRQVVVASTRAGYRLLWEIEFSENGLPVTLRGPEEGTSVTCSSPSDVRDAFLSAASHGLVGRKIVALLAELQAKKTTGADSPIKLKKPPADAKTIGAELAPPMSGVGGNVELHAGDDGGGTLVEDARGRDSSGKGGDTTVSQAKGGDAQ